METVINITEGLDADFNSDWIKYSSTARQEYRDIYGKDWFPLSLINNDPLHLFHFLRANATAHRPCRVPAGSPPGGQFASCGGQIIQVSGPEEGRKLLAEFKSTYASVKNSKEYGEKYSYTEAALSKSVTTPVGKVFITKTLEGKIGGAVFVREPRNSDALSIDLLGSMVKGHGSALVRKVARESKNKGYGGAIELFPTRDAVGFYMKKGFDIHPKGDGMVLLTAKAAKESGYVD